MTKWTRIIFNTKSVLGILAGRKTQTRRVIKVTGWPDMTDPVQNEITPSEWWFTDGMAPLGPFRCPYGKSGDRLWVRETWQNCQQCGQFNFLAGNKDAVCQACDESLSTKWRSPLFMPRWASRITLQITAVRVERLQDITEADALAEGVQPGGLWNPAGADMSKVGGVGYKPSPTARDMYSYLWDSLNAKRGHSWASNPWVWVVEFEAAQ